MLATFRHLQALTMATLSDLRPAFARASSAVLRARLACREASLRNVDPQVRSTLLHEDNLVPSSGPFFALFVDAGAGLLQDRPALHQARRFRMLSVSQVRLALRPGDWLVSLDLESAY